MKSENHLDLALQKCTKILCMLYGFPYVTLGAVSTNWKMMFKIKKNYNIILKNF